MPQRTLFTPFILLLVLMFSVVVPARSGTTGKIAGKIVDSQTGEALFGINVLVVGTSLGAATDLEGTYFIINLPPGTYKLKASAIGYTPSTATDVQVSADQTTRINFSLTPQAIEMGGVEVTVSRPIVQKDLTSTVSTVGRDRIESLPVEDVAGLVNLQAGVVEGHFRGGRTGEVKYLIDGMPVNDVFSGASALQPEVNSLEEVQVLSGTFNAEYGEALSGVVNQVTKVAGDKMEGQISAYAGDYITDRTSLFQNIGHISPGDLHNIEGSLGGPITGTSAKFFLSGRYFYDDGYIYGRHVFNPKDSSSFPSSDPSTWHVVSTGDGRYVSMDFSKRYTLQGKLNLNVGNGKGLVLQAFYQQHDYRDYDHQFTLNPNGDYLRFQKSFLGSASYNQVFNAASFLDLNASASISDYQQYVFLNPLDTGYANPERMRDVGGNAFLSGGTQNWHFSHHTNTYTGKLDYTSQVTSIHQTKVGLELQVHELQYKDFQVHVDASNGNIPTLPKPGDFDYNVYRTHPYQLSAYAQDKIEFDYLIINAGLRYDYFQPDGNTLIDPNNIAVLDALQPPYPDSLHLFRKASAKAQFSPRLGISYPTSDRGAIHLSYGHFFQIPPFEFLYKNPNFRIPLTGNYPEFVGNVLGNADLQPQRTTMYEIGLQQELAENLGITVTSYYKDIRNLLGLQIHIKNDFKKFGEYVNRDYGGVRGITIAVERRLEAGFGANLDYTYQVASGDASDPNDDFNRAQANPPIESNKQFVPLNWDRRHQLNVTLTVGSPNNLVGSLISRLGSGLPYTPSLQNQRTGLENSDNRPMFFNADLYITKYLTVGARPVTVYVKIYNVFDTANEIDVFGDTGRAGYTLELTRAVERPRGVNTVAEFFTRPDFYSAPRQVLLGASVSF